VGSKWWEIYNDTRREHLETLTFTKKGGLGSGFVYFYDNETLDGDELPTSSSILEGNAGGNDEERLVLSQVRFRYDDTTSKHSFTAKFPELQLLIISSTERGYNTCTSGSACTPYRVQSKPAIRWTSCHFHD
jgi:hypothetical protein